MEEKKSHLKLTLLLIIAALVIGLIVMYIFIFFVPNQSNTIQEVMLSRWNIIMPEDMELEYSVSTFGFPSDGEEYRVFKLKEEPTELIEDFNHEKSKDAENRAQYVFDWLAKGKKSVPEEWRPDWSEEYSWKYTGKFPRDDGTFKDFIYIVYFPVAMRLYTFEQML